MNSAVKNNFKNTYFMKMGYYLTRYSTELSFLKLSTQIG